MPAKTFRLIVAAEAEGQPQELLRPRHVLGRDHPRDPQIDLGKLVEADLAASGSASSGASLSTSGGRFGSAARRWRRSSPRPASRSTRCIRCSNRPTGVPTSGVCDCSQSTIGSLNNFRLSSAIFGSTGAK